MKLRSSHLLLFAVLGAAPGAWYGVHSERRGDEVFRAWIATVRAQEASALFCHAPPDVALPRLEGHLSELKGRAPVVAADVRYAAGLVAVLNERLERADAANAHWAEALRGCETCTRERWRELVQRGCKQRD